MLQKKKFLVTLQPAHQTTLKLLLAMARQMVTRYGMSTLGPVAFIPEDSLRGVYNKEHSEVYAEKIDDEVKRIMDDAWNRARLIITEYRHVLNAIAEELMRVENIEREDFEKLLIITRDQAEEKN
jgi:cell division protease FtsH